MLLQHYIVLKPELRIDAARAGVLFNGVRCQGRDVLAWIGVCDLVPCRPLHTRGNVVNRFWQRWTCDSSKANAPCECLHRDSVA